MPLSTYVARHPGPFAALVQAATLGGFRLEPLPPVRVEDRYWDTADGELLRCGYALRVRDVEGLRAASLRPLRPDTGGRAADAELGPTPSAEPGALRLPPGALAQAVADVLGDRDDRLVPLLSLRQFRTPRIVLDGERPVALMSFDVVVYEGADGTHRVANEAEVELDREGGPADLLDLDPALREYGLEPTSRTKLERGVLAMSRDPAAPLLLLPDERDALERLAETGTARDRRRARILLLDSRGYRADTIAGQTGVSTTHVRTCKAQFAAARMDLFRTTEPEAPPAYRVSELVDASAGDGEATRPAPSSSRGAEEDGELDLATFLDQFAPGATDTPLLEEPPVPAHWDDEDAAAIDRAQPVARSVPAPSVASAPSPPPATAEALATAEAPAAAEALTDAFAEAATAPIVRPVTRLPPAAAPAPEDDDAPGEQTAPRRPPLTGETPLLDAARRTLAYHVAAFDYAVARLDDSEAAARRLLLAVHRVRLAVETFRPTLPDAAAARLLAALRPLAESLDRVLDAGRAVSVPGADTARLSARRAVAVANVRAQLGGGRQQAWGARARRLLDRLHAQHADGLLLGDDFALPPDDFVGAPGSLPVPSRLRHAVGSVLWARFEAVLAFEDEIATLEARSADEVRDLAYHLAAAISALHFALGLAARATGRPVHEAAQALDAAEARVAGARHAHAAAVLAGAAPSEPLAPIVREVWASVTAAESRARLAAVVVAA